MDWALAWDERLHSSGLEANLDRNAIEEEVFWGAYQRWQDVLNRSGYPGVALERVLSLIETENSVLDIGAGSGIYTLPLARKAKTVTAIEPSGVQVEQLKAKIAAARLANVRIVPQKWQEVKIQEIGSHDIVLAAYCFQMPRIQPALHKMVAAAAKKLLLIHSAGNDFKPVLEELFGIQPAPDCTYLYNILCQMGLQPSTEIITRRYHIELEVQLEMLGYNPGLTQKQRVELSQYLLRTGRLQDSGGKLWLEREHRDGLITLDAQERRQE
ncbi:MAG: class I SAM-dependent methyltransferase [Dehalococcoidaceae bacterium]|nr:class I SAM-dependent methyltransferase [Dehalococcoidaceae bacterium]